jgi:hypothetical protein
LYQWGPLAHALSQGPHLPVQEGDILHLPNVSTAAPPTISIIARGKKSVENNFPPATFNMKPTPTFAVFLCLWLLHQTQARKTSKSRITQNAEPTNESYVNGVNSDVEPNTEAYKIQNADPTTITTHPMPAAQTEIEVVSSDEDPVSIKIILFEGLCTDDLRLGRRTTKISKMEARLMP